MSITVQDLGEIVNNFQLKIDLDHITILKIDLVHITTLKIDLVHFSTLKCDSNTKQIYIVPNNFNITTKQTKSNDWGMLS